MFRFYNGHPALSGGARDWAVHDRAQQTTPVQLAAKTIQNRTSTVMAELPGC
jgi:hypothetical protein